MLSTEQLATLSATGVVRLPGAIPVEACTAVRDAIWAHLEARSDARRDDPNTWGVAVPKLGGLRRSGALDPLRTVVGAAVAYQVLGEGWSDVDQAPQALVSLPEAGGWAIPHAVWHVDLPPRGPTDRLGAVRLLGFWDDVDVHGGGTVAVEGSHELIRRIVAAAPEGDAGSSSDVRRLLRERYEWFDELERAGGEDREERLLVGSEVDGVAVRVTELAGAVGDVVVMAPWTLHSIAPCCGPRPRLMGSWSAYASGTRWF